jgi:hypothetical protein
MLGLLIERWNGRAWTVQQAPDSPALANSGDTELTSVSCTSTKACIALSTSRVVRWNGSSWELQNHALRHGLPGEAVSCGSATMCVAAGGYQACLSGGCQPAVVDLERWNGRRWLAQSIPFPRSWSGASLSAVSCSSARACTAVGSWDPGSCAPEVCVDVPLVVRWNGSTWSWQKPPQHAAGLGSELLTVSCPSATACVAIGGGNAAERWNGTSWTIQPLPRKWFATSGAGMAVDCPTDRVCTAINGLSGASRWAGSRWSSERVANPPGLAIGDYVLSGIACPSVADCFAVGTAYYGLNGNPGSNSPSTLIEHWHASHWSIQPS